MHLSLITLLKLVGFLLTKIKCAIYWVGSYDAPTTDVNQYKWTSNNDHEQTETSILASTDDTKEFSYNNGIISFAASMQGVSKTFELKKQ